MSDEQLDRLRKICFQLPETTERLSHGEPTFFVKKRVFASLADGHHTPSTISVWLPAPPGIQEMLIDSDPETYFRPPYVGHKGWIGVVLDNISDEDLTFHIRDGWRLVAPKKLQAIVDSDDKL